MVKKILVNYHINDAQGNYSPGMSVSGKMTLTSHEDNPVKLKNVSLRVQEMFEKYVTQKSGNTRTSGWAQRAKTVGKLPPLAAKEEIAPGEVKEYDFDITLPNWKVKSKKNIRHWWVGLHFTFKSGMIASRGVRPIDAIFILPCYGSEVPTDIIQGMVAVSDSSFDGGGDYAEAISDQISSQVKGPSLGEWLKDAIPSDDQILKVYNNMKVQEDQGMGMAMKWNTPVIATRYGMALIYPKGDDQEYNFWAWTKLNKVKKSSTSPMAGGGSANIKGHMQVKRGRKTMKVGILLSVFKLPREERASFKARKKEFQAEFPQFYKTAMSQGLDAEDEVIMQSHIGNFDFDSSSGPDDDLFPGFSSEPAPASFDASPSVESAFPGDPLAGADDDDWMEEPPLESTPAPVSTPTPAEQDWDWDDFEE